MGLHEYIMLGKKTEKIKKEKCVSLASQLNDLCADGHRATLSRWTSFSWSGLQVR